MKKVNVKKEILVVLLIVVAMLIISTKVLATGQTATGNPIILNGFDTNAQVQNDVKPIEVIKQQENNTINVTNNTTNTVKNETVSSYENTALPQTGDASDYAIFGAIVVATVVAIYAYKKVRNYNI